MSPAAIHRACIGADDPLSTASCCKPMAAPAARKRRVHRALSWVRRQCWWLCRSVHPWCARAPTAAGGYRFVAGSPTQLLSLGPCAQVSLPPASATSATRVQGATGRRKMQDQASCATLTAAGVDPSTICSNIDVGAWDSTIDFSGYNRSEVCEV